jgi:ABC-type transporter Mla subunit MlaD
MKEDDQMASTDPYPILEDVLDILWACYQDKNISEKAQETAGELWQRLNDSLERVRKSGIHEDTKKYAELCQDLNTQTNKVQEDIDAINAIVDTCKKVTEYAKIIDNLTGLAAKLAAV